MMDKVHLLCFCMDPAVAIIRIQSCISTITSSDWNPDHEAPRSLIFRMFPVPDLQAHPSNLHNLHLRTFILICPLCFFCVCECV